MFRNLDNSEFENSWTISLVLEIFFSGTLMHHRIPVAYCFRVGMHTTLGKYSTVYKLSVYNLWPLFRNLLINTLTTEALIHHLG